VIPAGADGLVLLPYWAGVMNPFWDDSASGAVIGWRANHGPAHLYRATLEGIALEQRLHLEGVEAATGPIEQLVVMGGGSQSDLWCQILADTLNKPVVRAHTAEATALGAAMLAATFELYESVPTACAAMRGAPSQAGAAFVPGERQPFYDRLYREVYRGLYEDLRHRMERLWQLSKTTPS
jgi:xylulokinase